MVCSFGCNSDTAEDLVQEMYAKLHLKINEGLDISFGENDINHVYIFKTLRTLFLDLKRKEKNIYFEDVENQNLIDEFDSNNYDEIYKDILNELESMYWYDKKIFELIDNGKSIAELSRDTNISYYSLYNTYRKVNDKLKKILWDQEIQYITLQNTLVFVGYGKNYIPTAVVMSVGKNGMNLKLKEMVKFSEQDYIKWKEFRESNKNTIVQSEKELIANLYSHYYNKPYNMPCTCNGKIWQKMINDLNTIFENGL